MAITVTDFYRTVRAPLLLVATWIFCVTVHEAGHALAAVATGGKIKSFSILSVRPHVTVAGNFSDHENALKSAAGSAVFLGVWLISLLLPVCVAEVRFAASFFAFIEVLGWILSSIAYPGGSRRYDSWKFIAYSGIDQWLVVLVCFALLGAGAWYFQRSAGFTS